MSPPLREGFDAAELAPWDEGDADRVGAAAAWGVGPIDWGAFWTGDEPADDWAVEPIVPAGRQTALFSAAKTGKSLLALDAAAATATGRSVFGQPARDPVPVVYMDLEMTEADLRERLTDLGYGPDDDLGALTYFSLPSLPPLDGDLGGEILLDIVQRTGARLVVLDTMARVVQGEENSADTYRAFYRYTGSRLKAAGVALLRLDHEGRDGTKGARGSSAKDDDLDIVFRLTMLDAATVKLTLTRSRVPWVPSEVTFTRQEDPVLRHVIARDAVPAGTFDVIRRLDDLAVPVDATASTAMAALKAAGHGKRKALVLAALKARRAR